MVMIEDVDTEKQKRTFPRQYLFDVVFGEDSTQVLYLNFFLLISHVRKFTKKGMLI